MAGRSQVNANLVQKVYSEIKITGGSATTINASGEVYAVLDAAAAEDENNGNITFTAGVTDTLDNSAVTDNGGAPNTVDIAITGHSFNAGEPVTIHGTTNYDGTYTIVSTTANAIEIESAYIAETPAGTEEIRRPDSFLFNGGTSGTYLTMVSLSATKAAGSSALFEFSIHSNATLKHKIKRQITTADTGAVPVHGLTTVTDGDYIWVGVNNTTNTDNITINECSITVNQI